MQIAADLLANPGRALFVGFVLLVNHVYKTAIGYEACQEFLNYWIVPVGLQPLEKKALPTSQCKVVNLHGLRLPAKWSPRVADVYKMGIEIKAVTPQAAKLSIYATPTPSGIGEYSGIGLELRSLALKAFNRRYGSWKRFRAEFKEDRSMLEDILGAKFPKHLSARILPFFPPVSAHWRQTMLLTAKMFLVHRRRIWSLTGRKHFFYVALGGHGHRCEIYFGSLKTGRLEGELIFGSQGQKLDLALVYTLCGVLDQYKFHFRPPPVRARKPKHRTTRRTA